MMKENKIKMKTLLEQFENLWKHELVTTQEKSESDSQYNSH